MPLSLLLAIAVSAGVATGVFLDPTLVWPARWIVVVSGITAFGCAAHGRRRYATRAWLLALAAVSALLGADAQHRAMYPPLRQVLEAQFGGFAIETIGVERLETPIEIEGRLTADAAITEAGANLRIRVERIRLDACPEPGEGGVSITVAGMLA